MIEYIIAALAVVYGFIVVRDFHKFIKRSHEAIDRDQQIMDSIEDQHGDYVSLEDLNIIAIDTTDMAKQDAVLAFIDAWEKHHEHDSN